MKWGVVFETALKWNIAPMLYRFIKRSPAILQRMPILGEVYKSIEAAYVKTYMVNQSNFTELTDIIRRLNASDIEVLLLKGAHLAPFVYKDMGMRWMADIDILIRKKDLQKTHELLVDRGYRHPDMAAVVWDDFGKRKEVKDRAAVLKWYRTDHMHLPYSHPKAIQQLEVHWRIARSQSPFSIDMNGLWERAWTEAVNGEPVKVLSPEDLLLHICVHDAYYHHLKLFGLRPCCDVATVIRRFSGQMDWDALQTRACKWGVGKYLHLMLRLSQELLHADIPGYLSQIIRNKACDDRIFFQGVRRILGKEKETPLYPGMKYPSKIHVFSPGEGFLKKLAFFLKRIPISRRELASRYGVPASSARVWVYVPVRLAALLWSYIQVYFPYFWYSLKYEQDRGDYTLDLWLKSQTQDRRA
ncbi:MAG: nucleotidyltransferase family protein [Desulfobacteraceae bacterium]